MIKIKSIIRKIAATKTSITRRTVVTKRRSITRKTAVITVTRRSIITEINDFYSQVPS